MKGSQRPTKFKAPLSLAAFVAVACVSVGLTSMGAVRYVSGAAELPNAMAQGAAQVALVDVSATLNGPPTGTRSDPTEQAMPTAPAEAQAAVSDTASNRRRGDLLVNAAPAAAKLSLTGSAGATAAAAPSDHAHASTGAALGVAATTVHAARGIAPALQPAGERLPLARVVGHLEFHEEFESED